ncbi:MAG: TetR/AcrR family transcriptional regulator [Anaerolineae bacterium]|nr:TetR/AcrR family transcriptional regulator [Anaerolineae bacterium]
MTGDLFGKGEFSKGDQARAEILDAARRLFVSQGYHGTSMRALAREAGDRAVGGIYNHFPTKETIFAALIEERNPYETLFGSIEPALAEADTIEKFIHTALRVIMREMPKHYDFIQLAQIDAREFEGQHMLRLLNQTIFPRILMIIGRLQTLPGLKPIEVVVVLRMMASLIIGYMITDRALPIEFFHQLDHDQWSEQFANVVLYGIADQNLQK